ncbi:MAG: hypothetical protein N5P05_002164 [Chroococcopsis gigantea SAG 12.99]|jgi:GAF domain-containing protein|nr:GAF domain-containing protein [Chlorogloea purpurea SAG 13.99]MDV3000558.1 hypothetical protein [Chroococcopsis gigantea SAG 12.99]
MPIQFDPNIHTNQHRGEAGTFQGLLLRLNKKMLRDELLQNTVNELRNILKSDRVVIYYFYTQWKGQVIFESLSDDQFSILGSTGPDQCFNDEYATLYLAGRVRSISDIESEPIAECHRDFLRYLKIKANLVVPILTSQGLWGLLIAHHCQSDRQWLNDEIEQMKQAAVTLSLAPSIRNSGNL